MLGPVELWAGERLCEFGSAKERHVLAILLLNPGQPVSIETMIDRVWDDAPPRKARAGVHSYIARLRMRLHRQLGVNDVRVVSRPGTYALEVDPERVDLHRFRRLNDQARAIADSGHEEDALRLLAEAEELWRGEPLSGLSGKWVGELRTSLENEHYAAIDKRISLELATGRHRDVVGELYGLVAEYPYDESFVEQLMLALYRSGRQRDALSVYRQAMQRLADDLGTAPGPSLRNMRERIRSGDNALAAPPARRQMIRPPLADNLPRDTPDFTGRDAELERIYAALDPTPTAITIEAIDGMAGIGKTALAIHAAHRLVERYPDGRLYLHLHAHDPNRPPVDPADGLETLLRLIGEEPQRIPTSLEQRAALWRSRLAHRRVLVVLDDAAGSDQVWPFLPGAPGCLVMITSRRRLTGLDGVRPLSLTVLESHEAALLFRRIIGDGRHLEADAVDEVIRLCGHLPLAIAVVANQLRHRPARSVNDLVAKLSQAGHRIAEMHLGASNLATAFELSYRELSTGRQRAFRRLGLYIGTDMTTDAAAALIGCDRAEAEQILEELIDHHLIEEPHSGRVRFHDLLRAYAQERAIAEEPKEEPRRAVQRLLDFYLGVADQADRTLYPHRHRTDVEFSTQAQAPSFDSHAASEWLRAERANLLACIHYAGGHAFLTHAIQLSHVLATYLERAAHWEDAARAHEIARQACDEIGDRHAGARVELELSLVHSRTGHYEAAFKHAQEALNAFCEQGDQQGEAETYDHLARASWLSGHNRAALTYAERALAIFRPAGERHGEASALLHRGIALTYLGRAAEAISTFEESLEISRITGDRANEAMIINNIGEIKFARGYHRDALMLFREALSILREHGWRQNEAIALNNIASVHQYKGRHDEALHFYREALSVYRATGDRRNEANVLSNIGATYIHLERYAEALIHFQKALAVARTIGDRYEETRALHRIGEAQYGSGRFALAYESYERGLAMARGVADPYLEAQCLLGLGDAALHTQGQEPAETLWRQALAIFEHLGVPDAEAVRVRLQAMGTGRS
jgi:DNA-binding SARP family transcriptional activator/tetratricopeptide (TPR) repeat protein